MTSNKKITTSTDENTVVFDDNSREWRILESIRGVVFELDHNGRFSYLNQAWSELTGHSRNTALYQPLAAYIHPDDATPYQVMMNRMRATEDDHVNREIRLLHKDGHSLWVALSLDIKQTKQGTALFGYISSIDKHRFKQESLSYPSAHDTVTGAYNRHYFELGLQSLIDALATQTIRHSLLYIELLNFKLINQALSHSDGDIVLKEIADLLSSCLSTKDLLCRMDGYEFALLLHSHNDNQASKVANKILTLLSTYRYHHEPFSFIVGGNIGLRAIANKDISAAQYIADAAKATAISKKLGRNRHYLFTQDDGDSHHSHGCDWNHRIHAAIEQNRLQLYLQPIRAIASQQVNHYEALLRLIDADSGEIIQPELFIDAIEHSGAIADVDNWVIRNAIKLLNQRPEIQRLAINLSAHAFENAELHILIQTQLQHFNVAPQRMILELTETSSLINLAQTHTVIKNLHAIGCQFALDDFGTGFCSFSHLKHLPADYVKLDGSYIKNICNNDLDQAMVRSMNDMVHALGHKTIAECVESTQAIELLSAIGVDYIQGFSVGRPSPLGNHH